MADYGDMLLGYFTGANIMNALAMARELGIAQYLVDKKTPVTSQEIADALQLKERYVREVLACLAVGKVINVNKTSKRFDVPEENKKDFLTMAVFSRYMPLVGEKYHAVKDCIWKSGPEGVQYTDFPAMFDVLEDVLMVAKKDIIDLDILPIVPGLEQKLITGIHVGEFGTATGVILNQLAARYPKSSFLGSDVGQEPIDIAKERAANDNLINVQYSVQNLHQLPVSMKEKFDWVFSRDVIHDLPDPTACLQEIYKSLKPGGVYSMIDIGMSGDVYKDIGDNWSAIYYSLSTYFCIPESYQRSQSAAVGAGWGRPLAREILRKAGFTVLAERASHYDPKEVHFVCQK